MEVQLHAIIVSDLDEAVDSIDEICIDSLPELDTLLFFRWHKTAGN
jgi:hypothetical protein